MEVTLYKYTGERSRVDKSDFLIKVLSVTGTFKSDTSVLSPSLILSLPVEERAFLSDEEGNRLADVILTSDDGGPLDFNYFYIKEFRRFYYLTSLVISSGSLLMVSGEVDPLYSFKDAILANRAFIERNEFTYNRFYDDTLIPLKMEKDVSEYVPNHGSYINTSLDFNIISTAQKRTYTIATASVGGYSRIINNNPNGLPSINSDLAGDCGGQGIFALNYNGVIGLVGALMGNYSAYSTFFKSLVAYPYEISEANSTDVPIEIYKYDEDSSGFVPVSMGVNGRLTSSISDYRIIADFVLPKAESFLDYSPYSHYELYIPLYGWFEMDYNADINGHRILVYYAVNYENGSGEVYIYDLTKERILFSAPCQIGVPLSLSSSNAQELTAQKNAMQLNLILGLIGSGVGIAGGIASGHYVGAIGSGLSGVQAITSYINQSSLMFSKVQSTHNGSAGGYYAYPDVHLRITKAVEDDNLDWDDFAHQFGRPLRSVMRLAELSGYTVISKIHLENITATDAEKSAIESSLLSGVIL